MKRCYNLLFAKKLNEMGCKEKVSFFIGTVIVYCDIVFYKFLFSFFYKRVKLIKDSFHSKKM